MARSPHLLVPLLATALLSAGPATRMSAAELPRAGDVEAARGAPEASSVLAAAPAATAAAPRPEGAEGAPGARPALSPPATPPAPPGFIARVIIPPVRRFFGRERPAATVGAAPVLSAPAKPAPPPAPPLEIPRAGAVDASGGAQSATTVQASAPQKNDPVAAVGAEPPRATAARAATDGDFFASPSDRNWLSWLTGSNDSVPALVAGALPALRTEARRGSAPALPRQARLDRDPRLDPVEPEPEAVSAPAATAPASVAVAAPAVPAQPPGRNSARAVVSNPGAITLIPNDDPQPRERFREISVYFEPPPSRLTKPGVTPTSAATYEQK